LKSKRKRARSTSRQPVGVVVSRVEPAQLAVVADVLPEVAKRAVVAAVAHVLPEVVAAVIPAAGVAAPELVATVAAPDVVATVAEPEYEDFADWADL
jgi:hypothetical protein